VAGARLARRFAEIVREEVQSGGGELLELRGDEALAVFKSPRLALRSAVALQARLDKETVAGLPVVPGEYLVPGDDKLQYRFYPPAYWEADRLADAGFEIVEEARSVEGEYREWHLLLRGLTE